MQLNASNYPYRFNAEVIYLLFMPELSIAQLVGIYISVLCFVFCILYFVCCLIKMSLERPLEENIDLFQHISRLVKVN